MTTYTYQMVDVSSNDHENDLPIGWKEVRKAGYTAVMIKATQATDYVNPWLEEDAYKTREAGFLWIGYYHYAVAKLNSNGLDQANFFVEHIRGLPRNIGGALDNEDQELSWAEENTFNQQFLERLVSLGVGPKYYANQNWLNNLPRAPYGHPLWFASPGVKPRRNVWAWQKSWTGVVPGIQSAVDLNTLYI